MALVSGSSFGPYTIMEPLGRGGMASVYKAYEPALDRYVALKVLPGEFMHDETFAERFKREAKVIAKLEHPNIIPIHAFGIEKGTPWMAMRMIAGGALSALLKSTRVSPERSVTILQGVADALDYAHAKGIVHRDVKPQNVLLDEHDRVYLADFGIAKMLEGSQGLTQTGMISGTPQYMAPEQATAQTIDHRADIYALGVVAYEMLTGRVPFSADTPVAVLMKHVSDPIPLPRAGEVPEPMVRALLKALPKKPEDRWSTAADFVKALQLGLALTGSTEETMGGMRAPTFEAERRPTAPSRPAVPPPPPRPVSRPATRTSGTGLAIGLALGVGGLGLAVVAALAYFFYFRPTGSPVVDSMPPTPPAVTAMTTPEPLRTPAEGTMPSPSAPVSPSPTPSVRPSGPMLASNPTPAPPPSSPGRGAVVPLTPAPAPLDSPSPAAVGVATPSPAQVPPTLALPSPSPTPLVTTTPAPSAPTVVPVPAKGPARFDRTLPFELDQVTPFNVTVGAVRIGNLKVVKTEARRLGRALADKENLDVSIELEVPKAADEWKVKIKVELLDEKGRTLAQFGSDTSLDNEKKTFAFNHHVGRDLTGQIRTFRIWIEAEKD